MARKEYQRKQHMLCVPGFHSLRMLYKRITSSSHRRRQVIMRIATRTRHGDVQHRASHPAVAVTLLHTGGLMLRSLQTVSSKMMNQSESHRLSQERASHHLPPQISSQQVTMSGPRILRRLTRPKPTRTTSQHIKISTISCRFMQTHHPVQD